MVQCYSLKKSLAIVAHAFFGPPVYRPGFATTEGNPHPSPREGEGECDP
jgi:hypothetical protein